MNSGRSGKRAAIAPIAENKCSATFNFVRDAGKLYPLGVSPREYFITCGLLRRRGGLYSLPKLYSDKALLGRLGHTAVLPFSRELGPILFHLSHVPLNQPQERLMATQKNLSVAPPEILSLSPPKLVVLSRFNAMTITHYSANIFINRWAAFDK